MSDTITVEEFDKLFDLDLPETRAQLAEFIGGKIVKKQTQFNSNLISLANAVSHGIRMFNDAFGFVGGKGVYYIFGDARYSPDISFVAMSRQVEVHPVNFYAPDIAIDVLSSPDEDRNFRIKIANYLASNSIVWVINSVEALIEVYEAGKPVQVLDESATLTVETILPGFKLQVKDIFPPKEDT